MSYSSFLNHVTLGVMTMSLLALTIKTGCVVYFLVTFILILLLLIVVLFRWLEEYFPQLYQVIYQKIIPLYKLTDQVRFYVRKFSSLFL